MRKPQYYYTRSSQNITYHLPSPSTHQTTKEKSSNFTGIDLKRFNEYLEDKISSKIYKKVAKNSNREQTQSDCNNLANIQNQRESRCRPPSSNKQKQQLFIKQTQRNVQNKVSWKRHESIEKLLQKQKNNLERQSKKQANIDEQGCFQLLQRRYKQLQEKYKKLMQETTISAREYENDQRELFKLKVQHSQNQETLAKLQQEIMGIPKSKSSVKSYNFQVQNKDIKSQPIIQSDVSLISNQLVQNQYSNFVSRAHKTSQSWTKKDKGSNLNREQGYSRVKDTRDHERVSKRESYKHYSADKLNTTQRNSKMRQLNDQTHYSQSKKSIKFDESLSNSKVKIPKESDHKYEPQKAITPTTLHKKMLNTNQFSKYRFQPTVRLN